MNYLKNTNHMQFNNKNQTRKKINWLEVKQQYFESNIDSVNEFCRQFVVSLSELTESNIKKTIERKTKGWRDEKQAFKQAIFQAKQDKLITDPDIMKQKKILLTALKNAELQVANLIGNPNTKFSIADLKNIKLGWEMLRIATGQSNNNIGLDTETKDLVINLKL